MKTLFILLMAGLALSCTQSTANAQEFREHISKEFTLPAATGNVVAIYNISGFIKVEGYPGDKVIMEIDKTISAKTNEVLEGGKKEFRLEFEQRNDSIIAYIAEPYDSRPNRERRSWWQDHRRIEYDYDLAFTVKVPYNTNLNVSTVNHGNITVKEVAGSLRVNNVNGAITLSNAKGTTHAHTINGDLTVNYLSNPPEESSYYTLNGKLTVIYQPNLSADLQFKSMNGAFYTDFPDVEILPTKVTKTQEKQSDGTMYRINKNSDVRIGAGGKLFKFETLNGNIYIQKRS